MDTISRVGPVPAAAGAIPSTARAHERGRLSKLAVLAALSAPVVLVATVAAFVLTGDRYGAALMVGAGIALVAAMVISIVALVRISRSAGRLQGFGLALTGVVLSPLALVVHVGLAFLTVGETVPPLDERALWPEGTPTAWGEEAAPAPAPAPPRGPTLDGRAFDPTPAVKVVGGPVLLKEADRARIAAEIEYLWAEVLRLRKDPNPEVQLRALPDADSNRVRTMSAAERQRATGMRRMGILYQPPLDQPLEQLRLAWVVLDPGGTRARVVLSDAGSVLAFPVVSSYAVWKPALGPVEWIVGRPLEDEDRSGWLLRYAGESKDPAERVSGGPEDLDPSARHELLTDLEVAWRNQGQKVVQPMLHDPADAAAWKYRVYHVALDESGASGRIVLSDEWKIAIAVPFVRTPEGWKLQDAGAEWRVGTPGLDDQDGYLYR